MLHKVHILVDTEINICIIPTYIDLNLFYEHQSFSVTISIFLRHKIVEITCGSVLEDSFIRGKSGHERNTAFKKLYGVLFREISGIKDCMIDGYSVLFQLVDSSDERAYIYDVAGYIPKIDGHSIIAVNHIDQSDFTVYISVMVAYLRDVHLCCIGNSGTVNKYSCDTAITVDA